MHSLGVAVAQLPPPGDDDVQIGSVAGLRDAVFWPELMHRGMQVCGGNSELSMGGVDPWAGLAEIFQFLVGWVGFCPL